MHCLLLYSIKLPTYVEILLGLAPLIITILNWIIKIKFRKPRRLALQLALHG